MTENEIRNLRELLRKMQTADPKFQVSGSDRHHYRIGPPLSEAELLAFEEQHKVTLPADYRSFLRDVGNGDVFPPKCGFIVGGAGPGCGLFPLEARESEDFSRPFPFTRAAHTEVYPEIDDWGDDSPIPGVLTIGYNCGAEYWLLIVNGAAYGTVWRYDMEFGIYPTGLTFGAWYREWIDFLIETALPQLARNRIVEQVKAGMTRADLIALCGPSGGPWKESTRSGTSYNLTFERLCTIFWLNRAQREEDDTVESVRPSGIYPPRSFG